MKGIVEDLQALVMDIGAHWCASGSGGEPTPSRVIPALALDRVVEGGENITDTGYNLVNNMNIPAYVPGDTRIRPCWDFSQSEALPTSSLGNAVPPACSPQLNEDVLRALIQHSVNSICPGEGLRDHAMLMNDSGINAPSNSMKMAEICFEEFEFSSTYIAKKFVLDLFAVGKSAGVSINVGASGVSGGVVLDGYSLTRNQFWYPLGGEFIDRVLFKSLPNFEINNPFLDLPEDRSSVAFWRATDSYHQLKDHLCRVSPSDLSNTKVSARSTLGSVSRSAVYTLPDGSIIDANVTPFAHVPELLFNPKHISCFEGLEEEFPQLQKFEGLTESIRSLIFQTDAESRKDVLGCITISGGTSAVPGFSERINRDLCSDASLSRITKPRVHASSALQEKHFGTWSGGSILSSISAFQSLWINKSEYEEYGSNIVQMRCA